MSYHEFSISGFFGLVPAFCGISSTCGDGQKDNRKSVSYQRRFSCPLSIAAWTLRPPLAPPYAAWGLAVSLRFLCLFSHAFALFSLFFLFMSPSVLVWIPWMRSSSAIVAPSTPSLPHRSAPPAAPVGVLPTPPQAGVVGGSPAIQPGESSGWGGAASMAGCVVLRSWVAGGIALRSPSIAS